MVKIGVRRILHIDLDASSLRWSREDVLNWLVSLWLPGGERSQQARGRINGLL